MSVEIELKLQLTPKTAKKLAKHPLLAAQQPNTQQLLNTYFDTPDLALSKRRIAVRFRKKGWQWLLTIKTAEPATGGLAMRSEWETQATPGQFDFGHVDAPELRKFLEDKSDKLTPIFTTDFQRQTWQVPFGDSLIELALDRGTIKSRGEQTRICEIELELLSGEIDDIFGLTRQLQALLDLRPAIASKAERGYNLFLSRPRVPFKAKPAAIDARMTPVEAFRAIALGCLEHFQRNEQGLLEESDIEFVHQARVALRRLRSAIKLFAPVLPPEFVAAYGQTWRTLASALGEARNWDVFLEETLPPIQAAFPEDRDIKRLRNAARQRANSARRSIKRLIATSEYPCLIIEFTAAIYALNECPSTSLKEFATHRIESHTRRARKFAKRHATLMPEERHQMRLRFKKLRYALEFFAPLLARKGQAAYFAALNQIQDELGLINDHVTAESLLKDSIKNHPPEAIQGWLIGRHHLIVNRLPEKLEIWIQTRKYYK